MEYKDAIELAKAILESAPTVARKSAKTGFDLMMFDFYTSTIEALEKQIQKKPIRRVVEYKYRSLSYRPIEIWVCPTCNKAVEVDDNEEFQTEYYPSCECGQRIDWTGILEDYECKWNDYEVAAEGGGVDEGN